MEKNRIGEILDMTPELEARMDAMVSKGELVIETVQLTKEESDLFKQLQKEGKNAFEISAIIGK